MGDGHKHPPFLPLSFKKKKKKRGIDEKKKENIIYSIIARGKIKHLAKVSNNTTEKKENAK